MILYACNENQTNKTLHNFFQNIVEQLGLDQSSDRDFDLFGSLDFRTCIASLNQR